MYTKLTNTKFLFIIIVFLQLSLLLYLMDHKMGLFCDEVYTYSLSNSQTGIIFKSYGDQPDKYYYNWIDGKVFKNYINVKKENRFDYNNVYYNQTIDCHPPLYYYFIHTICSFFPEQFSKWQGFSFNLIIFIFLQILLFYTSKTIMNSDKYALLTCFIYGFSSGGLDCFVYIRMYALLAFLYLLLFYIYLQSLNNRCSWKNFIIITLVILLGSLTQYHFYIFAFFLTLTFMFIALSKKKYRITWIVSFAALFGVILSFLYFPYFYTHLINTPRGTEALSLYDRISPSVIAFSLVFQEFLGFNSNISIVFTILILISSLIIYLLKFIKTHFEDNTNDSIKLISISLLVYILFLFITIDYNSMGISLYGRYLFSVFPLITIVLIFCFSKVKKIYLYIFILLSILSNLNMLDFYNPFTKEKWSGVLNFEKVIENNNLIVYCNNAGILQTICPQLSKCNKIYMNPFNNPDKLNLPKTIYPDSKPTYLFVFPNNKLKNTSLPKIIEGELWGNKFEVFDLN